MHRARPGAPASRSARFAPSAHGETQRTRGLRQDRALTLLMIEQAEVGFTASHYSPKTRASAGDWGSWRLTEFSPSPAKRRVSKRVSVAMQISRRDLYHRVGCTPMNKLARELDISDVGLAKACRGYNIPRPPRGYRAKLAAGKASPKPGLPQAKIDTVEFDAARHRIPPPVKVEVDPASIKVASSGEDLAGIAAATCERLSNASLRSTASSPVARPGS